LSFRNLNSDSCAEEAMGTKEKRKATSKGFITIPME
jgi:hypothetical protein